MPRVSVKCVDCGAGLERWPSELVRRGRRIEVRCAECRDRRVSRPCSTCGKPITRRASDMRSAFVFCDLTCRDACAEWHAARGEALRARRRLPSCAQCGKPVDRAPSSTAGSHAFCGVECLRQWQHQNTIRVSVRCSRPGCTKTVERWPSELDDVDRTYCCETCKHADAEAWNPRTAGELRACAHCGRERWRWRSEHYIRFCSRSCWGKHRLRFGLAGIEALVERWGGESRRREKGRWAVQRRRKHGPARFQFTAEQQATVDELRRRGWGERPIATRLGIDRKTLRRALADLT